MNNYHHILMKYTSRLHALSILLTQLLMLALKKVFTFKCRFASWYLGIKANFLLRFWAQGLVKILSSIWCEILKLKLYQYFAADVWILERKLRKKIYNLCAYLEETENFTENACVSIEAHLVTNIMWDLGEDVMRYFMVFHPPKCRNGFVQSWIWSIWPILTNDSDAWLISLCKMKT